MKYIEVKAIICPDAGPGAVELVSSIFYDLNIRGLVINDSDNAMTDSKDNLNRTDSKYQAVTAYFKENDKTGHMLSALEKKIDRLEKRTQIKTSIKYRKVDEEDWAESWKAFFRPEKITEKLIVKPSWRNYDPKKDEIVLELDPGMAFGTGTHPTTFLCLNMIETYLQKEDAFLDIGTGSGILMIAAAKLGAKKITGIDNDDVAVEIAKENILRNNIKKENFTLIQGHLSTAIHEKYNLVVANILSEIILELLDDINSILKTNGIIIVSGIIVERLDLVAEKMKSQGINILETRIKESWVAIAGRL